MAFPNKKPGGLMIAIKPGGPPPLRGPDAAPPSPEPDQDEQPGGAPDNDGDEGVRPEWLDYTTEQERCANCEYMEAYGNCQVLKMPVGPGDHCKAFDPKQEQTQQAEQPLAPETDQGQPPTQ